MIAIMAILATLLLSAVSSAKKMGRQARCTSNLRQLGLAAEMYIDDFQNRPRHLPTLPDTAYLPEPKTLICPEDKLGNWGNLVNFSVAPPFLSSLQAQSPFLRADGSASPSEEPPFSYLHPLGWEDWTWDFLKSLESEAGLSTCQLHGIGRQNEASPSVQDYQGLILRLRRDGAVVRRHIFWNDSVGESEPIAGDIDAAPPDVSFGPENNTPNRGLGVNYPWRLFIDVPPPQ